jgi:hemerythrin
VVGEGKGQLYAQNDLIETLHVGDFWGEGEVLFNTPSLLRAGIAENTLIYRFSRKVLLDIPIVRWKLFETYERRMEMMFDSGLVSRPIFQWRDEYRTNVREMDEHHRELFQTANRLDQAFATGEDRAIIQQTLDFLIQYAATHFTAEQSLMSEHGFPEGERHRKQHEKFMNEVLAMRSRAEAEAMQANIELVSFFKDWIINHILTEDRKYGPFLNERGIR